MIDSDATKHLKQAKVFLRQRRLDEAIGALRSAISARPHYPEAYFTLGKVLLVTIGLDEAIPAFEKAVEQSSHHVGARYELANAYRDIYRYGDAEQQMREVLRQQPNFALGQSALGTILLETGQLDEALTLFADAMSNDSTRTNAPSNWVNTQQYIPGVTEQSLAESHVARASLFAPPEEAHSFANPATLDRPLKVGFVSPDLARHPVGRLSVGLFENLDRSVVDPFVFSTRPQNHEDELSKRISQVTKWTSVYGLYDDTVTALIREAQVDILFDMSGHTANHSLKIFADRAAPVQVGWLGYPGTTGLASMDYLLTNSHLTPVGAESYYSESIVRLPQWHACLDPYPGAPAVAPLPAIEKRFITFGCFNNPTKLNEDVIATFAQILVRVPGSRLKLQYKSLKDADLQTRLHSAFAKHGIASERVNLTGYVPHADFLSSYNDIDIALDTFPYSGCMTTCDATWMGCPVVSFPGATFAGRQASSYLEAAGLGALVARDRAHYEDVAVDLAGDMDRLAEMRAGLRKQLAASPVCDSLGFARDFETAMRQIWSTWCRGHVGSGT